MALRIWLPLNGNLNNQGLSNYQFINNGATVSNNGKIGSCYSFDGSDDRIYTTGVSLENMIFSAGCWFKPAAVTGTTQYLFAMSSDGGGSASQQLALYINTTGFCIHAGGSYETKNYTISPDTWYHAMYTCDGAIVTLYVNGQVVGTMNTVGTVKGVNLTLGARSASSSGAGSSASYFYKGLINDFRVYDECLSPKQIKEIAKGLVAHYPLNNRFNTKNLIINGYGELGGSTGWTNSNVSTTEIPSGVANVKASFYNGNSTLNNSTYRVPIYPNHTYTISAYLKSSGATSGTTYPSIFPYDIDGKFIDYFKCRDGFQTSTVTTLAQQLKPGDTVIYATDLSQWNTGDNYWYHVAIFGYSDSTGYVYGDLEYTQDSPTFGTKTDKSHINKTNNTITLNSAYTGKARPAGTKICQSAEGSTYYYPFGGVALSSISDWTFKTSTFKPANLGRLKYAKYWTYNTYNNSYHAAITLTDLDYMSSTITDESGNKYNCTTNGTFSYNNDSPRYEGCTKFDANTSYIKLPVLTTSGFANSFTIIYWANLADMNGKMAWGFGDGNRLNIYPTGSIICCNTGDGSNNPYQNNGSSIGYSQWNNGWHQFAMVADGSTNKLYVDGQYQGTAKTYKGITGTQMYISGWDTGTSYRWTNGSISDFRIYATALSADNILTMYKNSGIIDNKGNIYAYEFKEE